MIVFEIIAWSVMRTVSARKVASDLVLRLRSRSSCAIQKVKIAISI
jgi:hypothetical protein